MVIGHGAAGLLSASRLASRGYSVGVVGTGETATSLSTGCITMLHPAQQDMFDRDRMRTVFPYSLEDGTEELMMEFEDMFSFLIPDLDLLGLPIRGNPLTVRRMLTSVGTEFQCSIPQLFTLQGKIDRLREARPALLGIMGHRDSDPDLATIMASGSTGIELKAYWTLPRALGERRDLTPVEVARLCRRGGLLEEIAEALSEIDADLVGLPPLMDIHQYRRGMERLQSLSGRKVFELVTPLSLPGRRLQSALWSLAANKGCTMLKGWRATGVDVREGEVSNVVLEDRSRWRRITLGALIIATGDTIGGGLDIDGQRIFSRLLASAAEKKEMKEMGKADLVEVSRSGIEVDRRLRPVMNGRTIQNMVAAGSVIDGLSYPSGTGMGASMYTAWKAAETVREVVG